MIQQLTPSEFDALWTGKQTAIIRRGVNLTLGQQLDLRESTGKRKLSATITHLATHFALADNYVLASLKIEEWHSGLRQES